MTTAYQKSQNVSTHAHDFSYYDKNIIEKRYSLQETFSIESPFSFIYDSSLISIYGLKSKRFKKISEIIFGLIKKISKEKKKGEINHSVIANYVLGSFIDLDSTFIKIGQFLSTRGDLLPEQYINALSNLQDSIPALPFSEIKKVVEKELQKSINEVYKNFEEDPIASASIGQVHRAELLNGTNIVVKIQRPNLTSLFYEDLSILRCIAKYLERYTDLGKGREWTGIIDEIGKTLFEEIDFIQEGKNADHFRNNLKYSEGIYIPKIFWQFTTKKLITLEYVPGIKITDVQALEKKNINPKFLTTILVNAYFKQFFEDGFYHADPHPGNIVVKDDSTIVFYDFGMVGRINENVRTELANVLISMTNNDTDTLLKTLTRLELIKPGTDISPLKRIIDKAAYNYYNGTELDSLNIKGIESDIKKVFDEKPMKLPSKFTYTLRATGTLEGICRTLDPNFSLINTAKPYFYNLVKESSKESRWTYIKSLFPGKKNVIDKVQVYMDVIKELPFYVSVKENRDVAHDKNVVRSKDVVYNVSKEEINKTKTKLTLAYEVIFLLSLAYAGSFLLDRGNTFLNTLGLVLLGLSLFISIIIVGFSIFKRKMIE